MSVSNFEILHRPTVRRPEWDQVKQLHDHRALSTTSGESPDSTSFIIGR